MTRADELGAISGSNLADEDYIHQFLPPITVTAAEAALLVIDLQYATRELGPRTWRTLCSP